MSLPQRSEACIANGLTEANGVFPADVEMCSPKSGISKQLIGSKRCVGFGGFFLAHFGIGWDVLVVSGGVHLYTLLRISGIQQAKSFRMQWSEIESVAVREGIRMKQLECGRGVR